MFISLYNIIKCFIFCTVVIGNSVTWSTQYSPRDNFSPESEGSVNPKMEIQSREEITVCGMFTI